LLRCHRFPPQHSLGIAVWLTMLCHRLTPLSNLTTSRFATDGPGIAILNLPNLITIGRILLVPVIVWAIGSGQMQIAFLVFLIAGVSDAVDGFLAKRLSMTSDLGAHLDPLADKALIVSIYVALGITEAIPRWLVILVVSRDILIVGGVMLAWFVGKPMRVKPVLVSKLNTAAQIVLACLVLGSLAFELAFRPLEYLVMAIVAALTLASIGFYVREWVLHMNASEAS
jgi:cardiolipin synthase (CMP-forming)